MVVSDESEFSFWRIPPRPSALPNCRHMEPLDIPRLGTWTLQMGECAASLILYWLIISFHFHRLTTWCFTFTFELLFLILAKQNGKGLPLAADHSSVRVESLCILPRRYTGPKGSAVHLKKMRLSAKHWVMTMAYCYQQWHNGGSNIRYLSRSKQLKTCAFRSQSHDAVSHPSTACTAPSLPQHLHRPALRWKNGERSHYSF